MMAVPLARCGDSLCHCLGQQTGSWVFAGRGKAGQWNQGGRTGAR